MSDIFVSYSSKDRERAGVVAQALGDSLTCGRHAHSVNLVFQALPNGGWAVVHNCMSPDDCH